MSELSKTEGGRSNPVDGGLSKPIKGRQSESFEGEQLKSIEGEQLKSIEDEQLKSIEDEQSESFKGGQSESFDSRSAVLIDTNGFMIPVQFGIDIFSELRRLGFSRFVTIPAVLFELEKLSKTVSGNDRMAARVAFSLSKQCELLDVPAHGRGIQKYADDLIVKAASKYSVSVLTNDVNLRQKLIKCGVSIISMRQMNRLDFVG